MLTLYISSGQDQRVQASHPPTKWEIYRQENLRFWNQCNLKVEPNLWCDILAEPIIIWKHYPPYQMHKTKAKNAKTGNFLAALIATKTFAWSVIFCGQEIYFMCSSCNMWKIGIIRISLLSALSIPLLMQENKYFFTCNFDFLKVPSCLLMLSSVH